MYGKPRPDWTRIEDENVKSIERQGNAFFREIWSDQQNHIPKEKFFTLNEARFKSFKYIRMRNSKWFVSSNGS